MATCIRPVGALAARRCIISPISPGSCPTTSRSKALTAKAWIGRSTTPTSRLIGTRSPTMSASPATPRRKKSGVRPASHIPCRRCGRSRVATRGRKALTRLACGLRPQPSASTRRLLRADQLASMTAGAMSAVRLARCLIRWSPIWPKPDKRAPRSGLMRQRPAFLRALTERRRPPLNITTLTNKSRFRRRASWFWPRGRRRTRASCLARRLTSTRTDLPIQAGLSANT